VAFNTDRSVEPGFLVCRDGATEAVVQSCAYDGFRSNDDGPTDMPVLESSSDDEGSVPDWLKESCWSSIHSTGLAA
jgi:hypothetical protein